MCLLFLLTWQNRPSLFVQVVPYFFWLAQYENDIIKCIPKFQTLVCATRPIDTCQAEAPASLQEVLSIIPHEQF